MPRGFSGPSGRTPGPFLAFAPPDALAYSAPRDTSDGSETRPGEEGTALPRHKGPGAGGGRAKEQAGPGGGRAPLPPAPPQGPPGAGGEGARRGGPSRGVRRSRAWTAPRRLARLPGRSAAAPHLVTLHGEGWGAGGAPRPAATGRLRAGRKRRQLRPGLPSNRRRGGRSRSAERWMSAGARLRDRGRRLLPPQRIVGKGEGGRRWAEGAFGARRDGACPSPAPSEREAAVRDTCAAAGGFSSWSWCPAGFPQVEGPWGGLGPAEHHPVRRGRGAPPGRPSKHRCSVRCRPFLG